MLPPLPWFVKRNKGQTSEFACPRMGVKDSEVLNSEISIG